MIFASDENKLARRLQRRVRSGISPDSLFNLLEESVASEEILKKSTLSTGIGCNEWEIVSSAERPCRVQRFQEIFERLHAVRGPEKPWVFWHRYWSRREGRFVEGPFGDRKRLMEKLCERTGVRYFRFHALRHSGATLMDQNNVPIAPIQRILGHENRKITEIYLHSVGNAEREAMRVFERSREKSHTKSHTYEKRATPN